MNALLGQVKSLVDSLAEKIKGPPHLLPTFGHSNDGARPHIEIDEQGRFHYVIVERGEELIREIAIDTDDLLYKIFAAVTFSMACDDEAKHRISGEDFRRQMFARQEALLGALAEEWGLRNQKEHQQILKTHPFDDDAIHRADFCKHLRHKGMTDSEAWTKACKKFPLPKTG